jgi:3-oxoacyl-[acyl-carrier-protein] synthase-3
VPSSEFDAKFAKRSGWTAATFGVASRRFASGDESSSVMGALAAKEALAAANLEAGALDCIVSACALMEQPIPCLGALIQRELGLGESGIPAFDINATCLSFVVALDLLAAAIATGRYRRVLVVSSEIASAGINFDDPTTAGLFGDGAAAVVIEAAHADETGALLAAQIETFGAGAQLCQVRSAGTKLGPHGDLVSFLSGTYFEMDGRATYRMVADRLPAFLDRLLNRAGVQRTDLKCVVPHQASGRAVEHGASLMGIALPQMVRVLADRGNQVAASLPVALHVAISQGQIVRGDTFMMIGTGAGLAIGGAILRY